MGDNMVGPLIKRAAPVAPSVNPKELVAKHYKAWNEKNLADALATMHPDYIQHSNCIAPGIEGFTKLFNYDTSAFPDLKFTVEGVIAQDDGVAVCVRLDGKPSSYELADFWKIKDGKLFEHWGYTAI